MKANELENMFENGEDLGDLMREASITRPNLKKQRLNFDLPKWVISKIDREAMLTGVPRNSILKTWIVERAQHSLV